MMDNQYECEHSEGSLMGKCAICGKMVCGECYRSIFTQMICDAHQALEDEGSWELIGFYSDVAALAERRFLLEEQGIASLPVEADADTVELYVPLEDKREAWDALLASSEGSLYCSDCRIQYSPDIGVCPLCGVRPADS